METITQLIAIAFLVGFWPPLCFTPDVGATQFQIFTLYPPTGGGGRGGSSLLYIQYTA